MTQTKQSAPLAITPVDATRSDVTCQCGHTVRLSMVEGATAIVCGGCRCEIALQGPTHFIVQEASAHMPNSCWGTYRRIAVLEVPADVTRASMISTRSRDVVRIVEAWERLNVGIVARRGGLGRCAYSEALRSARTLAATLNSPSVA